MALSSAGGMQGITVTVSPSPRLRAWLVAVTLAE